VFGDATRSVLLQRLGVGQAKLVVVAITDPIATRQIVVLARSLNPDAAILARTRYVLGVDALHVAGADVEVDAVARGRRKRVTIRGGGPVLERIRVRLEQLAVDPAVR